MLYGEGPYYIENIYDMQDGEAALTTIHVLLVAAGIGNERSNNMISPYTAPYIRLPTYLVMSVSGDVEVFSQTSNAHLARSQCHLVERFTQLSTEYYKGTTNFPLRC